MHFRILAAFTALFLKVDQTKLYQLWQRNGQSSTLNKFI